MSPSLDWLFERAVPEPNSGCYLWLGGLNSAGYGPHRKVYEVFRGPIEGRLHIDHLCRVKSCVNPAHMEPVTQSKNLRRGVYPRKEASHCCRGHEFNADNIIHVLVRDEINGDRWKRNCRICTAASSRSSRKAAYRASVDHEVRPMGERTHCPHGHSYTPENTGITIKGHYRGRYCRQCKREATRLRDARRRQKRAAA